jgi:hypothetical protein
MEVFVNERKVRVNREIGRWVPLGGLGILIGGMFFSLRSPDVFWVSLISLVVGFFASVIGTYYANNWTRSPRADETLDNALKGISNHYHIYHYLLPVAHVLLGPAGLFTFRTCTHEGPITYDGTKWKQKFSLVRMLGFSGQDSLADPVRDALYDVQRLQRLLAKQMPEDQIPDITPLVVFVRDGAELDIAETEVPVLPHKRLKRVIRQIDKECKEPFDQDALYEIERAMLGDRIDEL